MEKKTIACQAERLIADYEAIIGVFFLVPSVRQSRTFHSYKILPCTPASAILGGFLSAKAELRPMIHSRNPSARSGTDES
jgi:hypothetical protein